MKIPSFKRLLSADFEKEYKKLIDQLSQTLNNGVEVLYNIQLNGISLRDNINCTVKDVIVTVDASGTPTQTSAFKLNNTNKVDGISIILALNQTNSSVYPISHPFITGVQGTGVYTIQNISGLQAGQSYLLRIVAFQQ